MTENIEIWKSLKGIVECGDNYEVSNLGNVRSIDRITSHNRKLKGQSIKPWYDKDGYARVTFQINNFKKNYGIHQLVAKSFIPNIENKPEVNHLDGNKTNNKEDNLEWSTSSENRIHAFEIGLQHGIKGEDNVNSKLTDSDVVDLFNKYKTNKYSMQNLADEYEITLSTVHNIVNGRSWKHLNLGSHRRNMSKSSIVTDELIVKVKELHSQGFSKRKIEKEVGVSRTTVTKILENY